MSYNFPSKEAVERLRKQYPAGARIELVAMDDPYSELKPGDKGTVDFIDDTGTLFCKWDSGSELGLVCGIDQFKKAGREAVCETGAEFWRDTAVGYGTEEAFGICGRYLDMQLKSENPAEERQFCRELFTAMYKDMAKKTDPAKLVYPYGFQKANERTEASYYHDSRKQNTACIYAIDAAIHDSYYKTNHYNLDIAAMKIIQDFGFERVNMALAKNIQEHDYDGRFSNANKKWAQGYDITPKIFDGAYLNSHPVLLDSFTNHARKLYEELNAERLALPGQPEQGEIIHGYEIVRAVEFDTSRGFAIGLNPNAVNPFVTWQFTTENGARDYYWGNYANEFAEAARNYIARTIVHMGGGEVQEVPKRQIYEFEKSTEQNYNMIDGLRNNEEYPKPDLTDGQTHEEIKELAPETLPENKQSELKESPDDKPSVIKQIREAQAAPKLPAKNKPGLDKKKVEPEL